MTRQEIAEARARCEAATKGEWVTAGGNRIVVKDVFHPGFDGVVLRIGETFMGMANVPGHVHLANAEFIADAHQTLPKALDALEAALDRIEELEKRPQFLLTSEQQAIIDSGVTF